MRRHKRQLHLALTPAGQAQQQLLALQAMRLAARAVAGFSVAELETLQALLQRVRGNLTEGDGP